jgi:MOZ/SAS family
MFLDHKSLFYDVEPFLFYVMTEVDSEGAHFVGYFSKEKRSPKDFNVSCIMTLPVRQKSGWGNLLIDFSGFNASIIDTQHIDNFIGYLLTAKEARYGTPERPLSKLGAIAYGRYWQLAVYKVLRTADPDPDLRMEDICRQTRMTLEDVFNTLRTHDLIALTATPSTPQNGRVLTPSSSVHRSGGLARKNLLRKNSSNPKLYPGSQQSGLSIYDLTSVPTHYTIHWDRRAVRDYLEKIEAKGLAKLSPENLRWSPYLVGRVRKSDLGSEGGVGRWEFELEDIPEPSMHSHTPLEPVERPPPPRTNSGPKTPKRNTAVTSGSRQGSTARARVQREGSSVPSIGQLSLGEWQEEPMEEEDDDDFKDDASTSPELRKPSRQRSSGFVGRLLTRQSRTTDEDEEDSDMEVAWKDPASAPRRTRSGKVLSSRSPVTDSDWDQGPTRRTRSKSHATKSTRRDESLVPSNSASLSEFQDEAEVQQQLGLVDSPNSTASKRLPSPVKKSSKRIIKTPSESADDAVDEMNQPWDQFIGPDQREVMNGQTNVEESEATPHMQSEAHGLANGVTSDDQLPQTPQVLTLEEQSQVGSSELQSRHQQGDGTFEWVNASFNAPPPDFHHPHIDSLLDGAGFGHLDATSVPLLHSIDKQAPQQQQRTRGDLSVDTTMESTSQPWPASGNGDAVDAMDTCDEDAEGEDEDAEGEEDLTIMA